MRKAYILSGSSFGDEGKGTFVDYLANRKQINRNIRYNGGSQASHTVTLDNGIKANFSQLGSSMFQPHNQTYLSDNTVINPFNLIEEAECFSRISNEDYREIMDRVFISDCAKIVTPYHKLTNQIREASTKRRGSFGTGVSEVTNILEETGICLYASDLLNGNYIDVLDDLYFYTKKLVETNSKYINASDMGAINKEDIYNLTDYKNRAYVRSCYKEMLSQIKLNIISSINSFTDGSEDLIFEGSQGLLIDRNYGIRPNTTLLDTTNHHGVKLADELGMKPIKIGLLRAFASRHGLGLLPTYDDELNKRIYDPNQESNHWLGTEPIYGWFDAALLRYADRINKNDEYYISCVDMLAHLDVLKICNSYHYSGDIDSDFGETFSYHTSRGKIIITDIIKNTERLKEFMSKCTPVYIELPGFDHDYSEYISTIENLADIKISLVSLGPKRSEKVRRKIR